jgi:hypothetical protein
MCCRICKAWSSIEDIASIHSRNYRLSCHGHLSDMNAATCHTLLPFNASVFAAIVCFAKAIDQEARSLGRIPVAKHGQPALRIWQASHICIEAARRIHVVVVVNAGPREEGQVSNV